MSGFFKFLAFAFQAIVAVVQFFLAIRTVVDEHGRMYQEYYYYQG